MNSNPRSSEKGQAIVYLAIGLIVFLGFVALAIDGGIALADRRNSQNAADASSLAGGGKAAADIDKANKYYKAFISDQNWNCSNLGFAMNNADYAAWNLAKANNFDLTYPRGSLVNNYVQTTCNDSEKYIEVTVDILSTVHSNFLQIIFPNALQNHVVAVTHTEPGVPLALGNAIVALNDKNCSGSKNGVMFKGNGDTVVNGGGVFSNGCLESAGRPSILINNAGFNYGGELIEGNADWSPAPPASPTPARITEDEYNVPFDPADDCNGHWVTNNDINRTGQEIGPGLYCFHGDFTTQAHDIIKGHNITFYVEGDITFNGNDQSELVAREVGTSPANGEIPGILIYVPKMQGTCPDQTVIINGTSNLEFTGIVLAPCADVTLNGDNGTITWDNQIIGYDVFITGNAEADITYNDSKPYITPPKIELYR
jgi:Flp pilus assembly protein TadG